MKRYWRTLCLFGSVVWRRWENPKDYPVAMRPFLIRYRLTVADAWSIARCVHRRREEK